MKSSETGNACPKWMFTFCCFWRQLAENVSPFGNRIWSVGLWRWCYFTPKCHEIFPFELSFCANSWSKHQILNFNTFKMIHVHREWFHGWLPIKEIRDDLLKLVDSLKKRSQFELWATYFGSVRIDFGEFGTPCRNLYCKRCESNETVGQNVKKYAGSWEFEQRMSRFLFGIHIHILDHLVVLSKLQNTRKMIDWSIWNV